MCGQHNARASAGDNTGQSTKDTHPILGEKLKKNCCKRRLIKLLNPWRYSPEEPRPTEVVAARWQ